MSFWATLCLQKDREELMAFYDFPAKHWQWRRLRGFDDLAKVITGIKFRDGIEVKEVDQVAA